MSSATIAFDYLPASIRKPGKYIEFNTKLAVRTLPANAQKVFILAQKTSAGSAADNVPVAVFSDAEASVLFGPGSQAQLMVKAALVAYPYLDLHVCPVADAGAGVAASCAVTVTGTATGTGVFTLLIGNQRVDIVVISGDVPSVIAAALAAQIALQPDLPVSASAASGVLTLTAKNKGLNGNGIAVSATVTASAVAVAVTAMSAGATNPILSGALAAIFNAGHTILISAWNDATSLQEIRDHLDSVSGPFEQRGSVGVSAHTGTLSQAATLAGSINAGRMSVALAPNTASLVCEVAAAYGAVVASEEDPARPLNTLALNGIAEIPIANGLGRTEQESLLHNGITPLEMGPGGKVQIVRAITTYTLDPQAVPDVALLDLTTIRTLDFVRKAVRERITLRFPREKLSARTPKKVRSEIYDVLLKLEELEIVELVEENKDGLVLERDSQDANRLNAKIPCDVVNGLHVFAARIDLLL